MKNGRSSFGPIDLISVSGLHEGPGQRPDHAQERVSRAQKERLLVPVLDPLERGLQGRKGSEGQPESDPQQDRGDQSPRGFEEIRNCDFEIELLVVCHRFVINRFCAPINPVFFHYTITIFAIDGSN